jgi:hypothetical protein
MHEKEDKLQPGRPIILGKAVESFAQSLTALRDFVTLVGSLLHKQQKELMREHGRDLIPVALGIRALLKDSSISEQYAAQMKVCFCALYTAVP